MAKWWEGEKTFWEVYVTRASLSEYTDPIFYYNSVHPGCSCWKHFLWTVMPPRGVNSRSAHPLFVRIHWSWIWRPVWPFRLSNFSEKGVYWIKPAILRVFIWNTYLCKRGYVCVSHLFLRYCSQFVFLNTFTPVFFQLCLLHPMSAEDFSVLAVGHSVSFERNLKLSTFPNQVQN